MSKTNKKYTKYDHDIMETLRIRYDFKTDYIQKSIRGERVGEVPLRIKEDYERLIKAKKLLLKKLK